MSWGTIVEDTPARASLLPDRCPLRVLYVSADGHVLWLDGEAAQATRPQLSQRDAGVWRVYRRVDLALWQRMCARLPIAEAQGIAHLDRIRALVSLATGWIELIHTPAEIAAATQQPAQRAA